MVTPLLSIISPVYKAENIIEELVKRIIEEVSKISDNFEIILVEDRSPDNSWAMIEEQCKNNLFVKGVKLSRNFGQHYAISAGLKIAKGDYVVVMDCDLQDNPVYISSLYEETQKGFDIVYTYKKQRKHSFLKNLASSIFFRVFNFLTDNKTADASKNIGSYSILSRKVVDAFNSMKEIHRHYLMVLGLLGFSSTYIEIIHEKRFQGKSSYTISKLVKHAITGITSQSEKLLHISISIGFIFFFISVFYTAYIVFKYFTTGLLGGYASTISLLLLGTGLVLISIGITGIYIGKIFEQVKERPLYFIDKTLNL